MSGDALPSGSSATDKITQAQAAALATAKKLKEDLQRGRLDKGGGLA